MTASNSLKKKKNHKIVGRSFRDACGAFATGVTVITTKVDDAEYGMTANAFMSISLDPPLVAISLAKTSKILDRILQAQRFAVSVLGEGMEDLAWHFAGKHNDSVKVPFRAVDGLPVLVEACAIFCTTLYDEIEAGDHVILIGHVSHHETARGKGCLMFHKGRFGTMETGETTRSKAEEKLILDFLETGQW